MSVPFGYDQFGYLQDVLALPNFFPMIPTYDDEGWNVELASGSGDSTYSDTALFQVNLTAPSNQVVATSGTCDPAKVSQGSQTLHCVSGPMRDFMIGMSADYQIASDTIDSIKVNSYYIKKDETAGRRGLQISVDSVKSYEQRIGPYPFNELDVLETPTTAGGIEFPGLVVVAQDLYQHNPTEQEGATAHEVAHQWWYSLVGDDQLDDPWLDEAFTQFTTALYYLDVHGQQGFQADISQDLQSRYQRALSDNEDMRADLPVVAYSDRQYGRIVYGKAALFFYALYQKMGDEKYNAFMQTYFQVNRYRNAHVPDLLKAIATQLDQATIDQLMKQWITTPN
jgi:aminopeptidase N